MSLRVVTYNVHKCRGMDGRVSATRVAEVLGEVDAELKLPFVLGENRKHREYAYGNVLLSRFPIRLMRNYDLSVRGREERGCLRADLLMEGGGLLHIFNVHLGTSFFERRRQA